MVHLGMANSRMKDFYDVWVLARRFEFDGETLAAAIRRRSKDETRNCRIQPHWRLLVSSTTTGRKNTQWRAFVKKGRLTEGPASLADVCQFLRTFAGATDRVSHPGYQLSNETARRRAVGGLNEMG